MFTNGEGGALEFADKMKFLGMLTKISELNLDSSDEINELSVRA